MSIIGSGANQLVVNGLLGSAAYFDVNDLPASQSTQSAIDAAIAGLATVARTGSYDDLTDKVPTATELELTEGTETDVRLFSPKQLRDGYISAEQTVVKITESTTLNDLPNRPFTIVLIGGGGGGGGAREGSVSTGQSGKAGGDTSVSGFSAKGGGGGGYSFNGSTGSGGVGGAYLASANFTESAGLAVGENGLDGQPRSATSTIATLPSSLNFLPVDEFGAGGGGGSGPQSSEGGAGGAGGVLIAHFPTKLQVKNGSLPIVIGSGGDRGFNPSYPDSAGMPGKAGVVFLIY